MCQKAEGESNYLVAMDRCTRKRGWDAFQAGLPISENPERTHPLQEYSDHYQWELGWLAAKEGMQPW